MQTKTINPEDSHIQNFKQLFGVENNITEEVLEKQRETFGFSMFLSHTLPPSESIRLGILNSQDTIDRNKNIWTIPHTYIFGGMALGFLLQAFSAIFLFLPIFFAILFLSILPILRVIREKIELYKASRLFFNITREKATELETEFFSIKPPSQSKQLFKTKKIAGMGIRTFLLHFGQPFIFGHLHFFAGISFRDLFIFDIAIFLVVFGLFEKIILGVLMLFYSGYFKLLDSYPKFFNTKDQERDFYMDIYRLGTTTIENIHHLEQGLNDAKDGLPDPHIGTTISESIANIGNMVDLIEQNEQFLVEKQKFKSFLTGLMNELLMKYTTIFDILQEKISGIIEHRDTSSLSVENRTHLSAITEPILEKNIIELQAMKSRILSMRIL